MATTTAPMTCARCHRQIDGGWADGGEGVICERCMNLATGSGTIREAVETIHALAHHGYPERACPICLEDAQLAEGRS